MGIGRYERKSRAIPLGRKLEGRVFVGEIRGNNFKLTTRASSRNFNDAMTRNRQFTILISDRMEY